MIIRLGISGACGKMGSRLLRLASEDKEFKVIFGLEHQEHKQCGKEFLGIKITSDPKLIEQIDVLIEFSTPLATLEHLNFCIEYKKPMVIGTTGFSTQEKEILSSSSRYIPILLSPNMSLGVNLLFDLVKEAARILRGYKINIIEAHHIHKKDAPSGTAKRLASLIEEFSSQKINIESIREDEIIGDHEVIFDSPWDKIKLSHSAKTRDIFAKGALRAAKWILKKPPGFYDIKDMLKETS
jgi:4-hydroxy-tetrahydrodipicolinate reductase